MIRPPLVAVLILLAVVAIPPSRAGAQSAQNIAEQKRHQDDLKRAKALVAAAKKDCGSGEWRDAFESYAMALEWDPGNKEALKGTRDTWALLKKSNSSEFMQIKLDHIIIPLLRYQGATLSEAIEDLRKKSVEFDTMETDPAHKGVKIAVKPDAAPKESGTGGVPNVDAGAGEQPLTLQLTRVPLSEALRMVTSLEGVKMRIDSDGVRIVSLSDPDPVATKEFKVPSDFLHSTVEDPQYAWQIMEPDLHGDANANQDQPPQNARTFLMAAGITFPPNADASYDPAANKLVVTNTDENLDLVDQIVKAVTPPTGADLEQAAKKAADDIHKIESLRSKLDRIIIPEINFRGTTVRDAIKFLAKESVALDTTETVASRRGVKITTRVDAPPGMSGFPASAPPQPAAAGFYGDNMKFTLIVKNMPLSDALRYVTGLTGLKYKVTPSGVLVVPLSVPTDSLITKQYYVPPDFLQSTGGSFKTAQEFLEKAGVGFPPGTAAKYLPAANALAVRQTEENLDFIDLLVEAATPHTEADSREDDRIAAASALNAKSLREKLDGIVIPKIEYKQAAFNDVMFDLMKMLPGLDTKEAKPARRGINFVWNPESRPHVSLSLTNVTLWELLRQVAAQAGVRVKIDPHAVVMAPLSGIEEEWITKEYKVPAGFPGNALRDAGMPFQQGTGASFFPGTGRLVLRNTDVNIDLADKIVDDFINAHPAATGKLLQGQAQVSLEEKNGTGDKEVDQLLREARGFYDSWRFDLAYKRYDQVLNLDPHNAAALKGQDAVNATRLKYTDELYDELRNTQAGPAEGSDFGLQDARVAFVQHKLTRLIIPGIEFKNTTLREAIELLHKKSVEIDSAETDPVLKGVNVALTQDVSADAKINLALKNIPLSEAMEEVAAEAGLKVKINPLGVTLVSGSQDVSTAGTTNLDRIKALKNKLNHTIIPKIDFKDTPVGEALDLLRKKSIEFDTTEPDPVQKGVNIVDEIEAFKGYTLPLSDLDAASPAGAKITLSLENVTLSDALKAITNNAGLLRYKVEPYAVVILPVLTDDFATKEYKVPEGFLAGKDGRVQTARELLEASGVKFPEGATASYIPSSSKLVIRDSDENLDLVDQIVDAAALKAGNPGDIRNKLDRIIIPAIEFRECTVREAIAFLHQKSVELDATEPNRGREGGLKLDAMPMAPAKNNALVVPMFSSAEMKISLSLRNIPMSEALRYIAALAGLQVNYGADSITIESRPKPVIK